MRRHGLPTVLALAALTAAGGAAAQAPDEAPADEGVAYVLSQVRRDDWGTPALRDCGGRRDADAAAELPRLQEGVALTVLTRDWEAARPVLEDYVTCSLAAGDGGTLAEALDLRAQLERWNGGILHSPDARTLSNRFAVSASLLYGSTGRYERQVETLVKLADFHDLLDGGGTMACRTLHLARLAAARSGDAALVARVREAGRRLVCPEGP